MLLLFLRSGKRTPDRGLRRTPGAWLPGISFAFLANKIQLPQIQTIYGPDFNYRSRFQFTDGGLCQKNANNIIPIDECLCAEPLINDYLAQTPPEKRPAGRTHFFASQKALEKTVKITDEKSKNKKSVQNNRQSDKSSKKYNEQLEKIINEEKNDNLISNSINKFKK